MSEPEEHADFLAIFKLYFLGDFEYFALWPSPFNDIENICQNHTSLMMFTGKTQSESWVCKVPDGPFGKQLEYLYHENGDKNKDRILTKFLEGALGNSWEDSSHGVNPVFGILLHHAGNLIEAAIIILDT